MVYPPGFFGRRRLRVQSVLSGIGATAVIYPTAFLTALGEGTLNLGIIFLMRDTYAATPSLIGWLMSSGTLVYVAGCLFVRPRFATLRPRQLLLLATAGIGLSLGLLYALRAVPLTFLFFSLNRLSASFFWPPAMGWLTENREGKKLNRVLSRFNLCWSLGLLISPALAGWLSELDPGYPVLGTIAMQAASFLLIAGAALTLPSVQRQESAARRDVASRDRKDSSTSLRFTGWIGLYAGFITAGVIVTVFPQYARDVLGTSKSVVGTLLSLRMLARSAGFIAFGALRFWHHRGRYQLVASSFLLAVVLVMTRLRSLGYFSVLIPVFALGNSFTYIGSQFHGVAGSIHRASRTAIHEALLSAGLIVGASAGGLFYQHASFQAALLFCALCLLAALVAQAAILAAIRRRSKPACRRRLM